MLTLKDIDTGRLQFNPNARDFVSRIEKEIPSFLDYDAATLSKKKLYTYIVLVYDLNSPMRKEVNDFYERKRQCAIISGFNTSKKGKFSADIEKALFVEDEQIAVMIADFVASFNDPDYVQYIMYLGLRQQMFLSLLNGESIKTNIHKDISAISESLKDLERRLFGSGEADEAMEARKALYARAERDRTGKLRPEAVAEDLANAGECPYEDDYKVDDMQFIGDSEEVAKKVINGKKERN